MCRWRLSRSRCSANPSAWVGTAAWDALGFSMATEHAFVYSYWSDGQRAQATAYGDLDCDTVGITFVLDCAVAGGVPDCVLVRPMALD